jgi:hypothetical protein
MATKENSRSGLALARLLCAVGVAGAHTIAIVDRQEPRPAAIVE